MRVVWLCLEWPSVDEHVGGVARYSARLAREVARYVELTVVAFEGGVQVEGVNLVYVPRPTGRFGRYYLSPRLAAIEMRDLPADVVHAHGDDWWLKTKRATVRSFYGTSAGEARSSSGLRRINHWILAVLEFRSARRAALKLAIAPESMQAFKCDELFPPILSNVGRLPISHGEAPLLVFVGSYHGRKRGYLALEAAERCRQELRGLRLVVVGPEGDADNWPDWVEHHAGLSDEEVRSFLSSAWVVLAPSSYEGFGIPIVEGLAAGARVFATPNPGCDYISSFSGRDVPLEVFPADTFAASVARRIRPRPAPGSAEFAAADSCVGAIVERGSPTRLVEMYRELLRADA